MIDEMPKAYEAKLYEDALYKKWLDAGVFNPDNTSGEPYSIMMPPPNVTGVLHLGHALENALMDAMARYQRLQGKKVLLLPGTDHAAIATQAKVEKQLMAQGIKNPRQELGRDGLLEKIRLFAEESRATILSQVKKLGTSADWSRLAYTFDAPRNIAVNTLFKRMYDDGLIYRGYRVVNWSVKGQSTHSDDEIIYVERPAKMYTFKYSKDFPITIASTRPETKLGDTAVAVHPSDVRYQQYIGQAFTVDVGAAASRTIRIIADSEVDPNFGTGALGVTPAHSAIDFGMYEKQKAKGEPIDIIPVIGIDGRMTAEAGKSYAGKTAEEARELFVAWLKEQGLLEKEEDIVQNVGTSDRFGDVIEALPLTQWWLNVNAIIPAKGKTLKDLMREAVTTGLNGNASQKVEINPERFTKLYLDRVDHLRDWCLSRQTWWGHRIPVWYKGDEMVVGEAPSGDGWTQDEDTLDTWFSSGSWTFSTLGWPNETADLKTFHPTSWIQMGYEILYLWLMRMILMSTYALGEIPFKNAYIHGILRDKDGKKFSKSSGNGIDPIEVITSHGCDALRISVLSGNTPGNDSRYYEEKVESARNLVNKLWNISRFVFSVTGGAHHIEKIDIEGKEIIDREILGRFNETVKQVTRFIETYDFSLAIETLREFTWTVFADEYLEDVKKENGKDDILLYILERLLILWHPFAPFVTEEIFSRFSSEVMMDPKKQPRWPHVELDHELNPDDAYRMDGKRTVVSAIRNLVAQNRDKIEPKVPLNISISEESIVWKDFQENIKKRTNIGNVLIGYPTEGVVSVVAEGMRIAIHINSLVDPEKEKSRITKELAECTKFIAAQEAKLANADFVARAPEKVIAGERQKLSDLKERYTALMREQEKLKLSL